MFNQAGFFSDQYETRVTEFRHRFIPNGIPNSPPLSLSHLRILIGIHIPTVVSPVTILLKYYI